MSVILFMLSIILTVIWYLLVIYVIPYERVVQIFWQRGLINIVITYVGILGLCLVIGTFLYNLKRAKQEILPVLNNEINFNFLQLLNTYKNSVISKVNEDYNFLYFFSTMCVSLGFLGTVLGLSGGISNLSAVFTKTTDLLHIKNNVFKLIGNLGIAFDSTLLGLIFSIVIALIISFSKKFELKQIGNMFDATIHNALLKEDIAPEMKIPDLKLPEIDNQQLQMYIENMRNLSNELTDTVAIHKELLSQISQHKEILSLSVYFDKIVSILTDIDKSLEKPKPRAFRIIEETER